MNEPVIPTTTTTDPVAQAPVAVLPVGSFEQHGPFLPLGTDTLIATAIATAISEHHNTFQLPPITFGCSHEHAAFPGTISISAATLTYVIEDIAESAAAQGAGGLLVVNAHGGNAVLTNVVQQTNRHSTSIRLGLYPSREDWTEARTAAAITSSNHDDMHAGELETSILLAAYHEYLRDGWNSADHAATDRRHLTTLGIGAYTRSGVIGYPSAATQAKGQKALDHLGRSAKTILDILTTQQ
ncbi:creatinine amidohydrolase [Mycobacteroides abscessus subsp. massiliense]|uniref:creatininase family protein n=1 Tax=Mycobacteroides abscessus TaxID=36809 RepID=UPI0009A7EDD7|nr:creatininase family protein [Mycobacteroides abscessus]SKH59788.1 creatinine amidohydrolase [Mycobacteroides abscessus subsp. massiliense]SKH76159.1 creatinine amidohydrolase [Mycobacteroides abscessus subsp. massiliense]SKI09410.1 creatinine amidohydrolase [Mycobacteroides abscessus subsp. massiliense]SKI65953.1 creatinine amidohydrolase [Mycobacteroides abscessus subsp. massiliense]SKJ91500.1 creatinine amidohydrolase [Mycobacteroides abscessus subsp. massiliense]